MTDGQTRVAGRFPSRSEHQYPVLTAGNIARADHSVPESV